MSNLLLEFNKKDLEAILKDEEIFTIAYEIELEATGNDSFGERSDIDLRDVVSEEDIIEVASEQFSSLDPSEFLDWNDNKNTGIGGLYVEWVYDEQPAFNVDWVLFRSAESLGLLGESVDEDLLDHMGEVITDVYYQLLRGDTDAWRVFSQMVISNPELKDYVEDYIDKDDQIKIADINQLDMFGEESKLDSIANLIKERVPKDSRRVFFGSVLVPSFRAKNIMSYQISMKDFLRAFYPYMDFSSSDDTDNFDDNNIENMQQIFNLYQEMNIEEIQQNIITAINDREPKITSMSDFDNFEIEATVPFEYANEFDNWVVAKFREFRDDKELELYEIITSNMDDYFDREYYTEDYYSDDVDEYEIEEAVRINFPNFYSKWGNELTFTTDSSLRNGFEMFPSSYISTLEDGLQFIRDFYEDYDRQNKFEFDDSTGLHTNIGIEGFKGKWNYFKGFLFTNDNFATRGFDQRLYNGYSQSLKKTIMRSATNYNSSYKDKSFASAVQAVVEKNFEKIEEIMNRTIESYSSKHHGFSIRHNRIEFRYPGGEVLLEDLEAATLYYAYIVKLCTDPSFKRKEYIRKAVAFILGMEDKMKESELAPLTQYGEEINLNRVMLRFKKAIDSNPNPRPMFKTQRKNLDEINVGDVRFFLDPGSFLKDNSKIENFNISNVSGNSYEGAYEFPIYFIIEGYDEQKRTADISVIYEKNTELLARIRKLHYWQDIVINKIKLDEAPQEINLYKLIAAFEKGLVEPVSTDEYAKLMIFQDQEKADQLLLKAYPWISEIQKAIALTGRNEFSDEEAGWIENGTFERIYKNERTSAS